MLRRDPLKLNIEAHYSPSWCSISSAFQTDLWPQCLQLLRLELSLYLHQNLATNSLCITQRWLT